MALQSNWLFFTNLNYLVTPMNRLLLVPILLTLIPVVTIGDDKISHKHSNKMDHKQHQSMMALKNDVTPVEAGHDGFAAIAEIVKILSDNPNTNWSKVNINSLRNHLLDMDRLVSGAKVDEQKVTGGMRFNVTGETDVLNAIKKMIPAHAIELDKMPEYETVTETIINGIALTVTGIDDQTTIKIKGLGFFGLMATGSHHKPHHLGMATGKGHGMKH